MKFYRVCSNRKSSPAMLFPRIKALAVICAVVFMLNALTAFADPRQEAVEHQLADVVVTASGFEQALVEAPASITVITREQLEQKQVRNIAEALRGIEGIDISGVDARSNKTGNQTISLRGLPSQYTLILIDGRRQNTPGTVAPNAFDDSATAFMPPVAAIERIEVIRGPMSTLYGSDAMGGVVNIITRRPTGQWAGAVALDTTFQSDSEFGGNHAASAFLNGPILGDTLALQLYGRAFERAESRVRWPGQNESLVDNRTMGQSPVGADIFTYGGKFLFAPNPDHEIILGGDTTRQTYNNDRGQIGRIRRTDAGALRDGYDTELGFNRDQYYLGHTSRFAFGLLGSSLMRNETDTTGRTIPEAAATPESGRRGAPRTLKSVNTVLDTKLVSSIGPNTLSIGGQWWEAELTDGIPDATFKNRQWATFIENEWRIVRSLALTVGARYDDHDAFSGRVTPRGYLVWNTTDQWTLKGGVAKGYRTPWLEQLHDGIIGYGNNGQTPLFGNPDLKPETSTNYELSAHFDSHSWLLAHVTVFRSEIKDKIERPTGAGSTVTANIGEAVVQGVEIGTGIRFARDWSVTANYTYTDSEVTTSGVQGINKGDPLFHTPEHMVNATLGWQATRHLNTWISAEYRSERFRADNFHEPHLGGQATGAKAVLGDFKAYTLLHLGGVYRFTEKVTLNATIYNLLDKNFVDYRPYHRDDTNTIAYSNVYNTILEPRRLFVGLNVAF